MAPSLLRLRRLNLSTYSALEATVTVLATRDPNIMYAQPSLPYQFDRTMEPIEIGETHAFIQSFLSRHASASDVSHGGAEILPEEIEIQRSPTATGSEVLVTFMLRTCMQNKSELNVEYHLGTFVHPKIGPTTAKWEKKPKGYALPGTHVRFRCHA